MLIISLFAYITGRCGNLHQDLGGNNFLLPFMNSCHGMCNKGVNTLNAMAGSIFLHS